MVDFEFNEVAADAIAIAEKHGFHYAVQRIVAEARLAREWEERWRDDLREANATIERLGFGRADAQIAALRADQADWRKGVNFIRSCLPKGQQPADLSCVDIGEKVLETSAALERAEAEAARLRGALEKIRDGGYSGASFVAAAALKEKP